MQRATLSWQPRENSLHSPALPPLQPLRFQPVSKGLCVIQRRRRARRRAGLSWKDPTCLGRGLLSTGNNCHVSVELHRLSQAVVSTFLATFHQHT